MRIKPNVETLTLSFVFTRSINVLTCFWFDTVALSNDFRKEKKSRKAKTENIFLPFTSPPHNQRHLIPNYVDLIKEINLLLHVITKCSKGCLCMWLPLLYKRTLTNYILWWFTLHILEVNIVFVILLSICIFGLWIQNIINYVKSTNTF